MKFSEDKEMIGVINEVPDVIMKEKEGKVLLKYKQGISVTLSKEQQDIKGNVPEKTIMGIVQSGEEWK